MTAPGSAVTSDQEAALNNSNHTGDNATDQSLSDQGAGNSQANQEGQQSAIEGPAEPSQTALALADAPGTDAASAVAAGVTLGADSNGMLTSQHDASGAAVQSVSTPLDVDAMPDQASCPSQVDMPDLAHPDGGAEVCDQAVALQHRSQDATSPADAQNCSVQFSASNLIAPSTADGGSASDLSCRQAFAALQYATGEQHDALCGVFHHLFTHTYASQDPAEAVRAGTSMLV